MKLRALLLQNPYITNEKQSLPRPFHRQILLFLQENLDSFHDFSKTSIPYK